jgi:hypothetical protein
MIRLIASPARSGFYSRLFYFTAPAFWERALKKKLLLICLLLQRPGQRAVEPFELWEYSCAELFALIKVLRQSSMKNMCVSDLFASFA